MDQLARVTGGLMTEATTDKRIRAVHAFTTPAKVARARITLSRITPFPAWVRSHPRTPEAIAAYKKLVRELGAIIAGHRPDQITLYAAKPADVSPTNKEIEKTDGA